MRTESRARPFASFPKRLGARLALAGFFALAAMSLACSDSETSETSDSLASAAAPSSATAPAPPALSPTATPASAAAPAPPQHGIPPYVPPPAVYEGVSLWTPDGSRIVFSHAGGIYVVEADGAALTALSGSYEPLTPYVETAEIDFSPTLSPDGSRVAYATFRYADGELSERSSEIAVQSMDGAERVRLTNNQRGDIAPSWSPDGSRIAFASPASPSLYGMDIRIFTIAPDGSGEREIAASTTALCCELAWSPDGGRLAFLGERRETASLEWVYIDGAYNPIKREMKTMPYYAVRRQAIYTVKADGSGLVELAWPQTPNAAPKTRFGRYDLYTPEESASLFRWSPDGARLAFVARRYGEKDGIYIADAEGASVRRIFDLAAVSESEKPLGDRFMPGIAFSEERIYEIAWSPDGSRIEFEAFVARGEYYTPAVYSVSADGSDLRQPVVKEPGDRLKLSEKIRNGSGPKRIIGQEERYEFNPPPEMREWILSTSAWGESKETVLVKILDNRLIAVDSNRPIDLDAECDKAISGERRTVGLMRDCRTLLEIKDALAYDSHVGDGVFSGWSGYRPISEWTWVTVEGGRVRALEYILDMPLKGTIPPKTAELTELRTLHIRHNELEGEIPPELGRLSKLEVLDIGGYWDGQPGGSRLAGRIPPELGSLSNLRVLDLGDNELQGEIPAELGSLSNLKELDLSGNDLEGEMPPELGDIPSLVYVDISENERLTGCIPPKRGLSWEFYPNLPLPHCE